MPIAETDWKGEHLAMSLQGLDMRLERYENALAGKYGIGLTTEEIRARLAHAKAEWDRRVADKER